MLLDHMTPLRAEFEQAEMTGGVKTRVELEELDKKLSNQDTKSRMVCNGLS